MHLLTPGLKETEMADFPPLSYTSTIEIPTLSYTKSLKKLPLLGEPPCIGHHREYPPPLPGIRDGECDNACEIVLTNTLLNAPRSTELKHAKFITTLLTSKLKTYCVNFIVCERKNMEFIRIYHGFF